MLVVFTLQEQANATVRTYFPPQYLTDYEMLRGTSLDIVLLYSVECLYQKTVQTIYLS